MKQLIIRVTKRVFDNQLDFKGKLFMVLGVSGTIISFVVGFYTLLTSNGDLRSTISTFSAGVIAPIIMIYVNRSKRYTLGYLITIAIVFIILFPIIFLTGGGYTGGMPSFFTFAVLFTVFMLDGYLAFFVSMAELSLYTALCVYAYNNPEIVIPLENEFAVVVDIIAGFLTTSLSLGLTMFLYIRTYNAQQRLLETARQEA
ncbi:MAG: hypothetical protein LBS84_07010, partial [Clostridiales bacterium]|nr:hypothetical protein [Clostridiales bacterium]